TLTGGEGTGEGFNGAGGAIFANQGSLTLERVNVTGNSASNSAGGVYFAGGPHQITGSTVSANTGSFCAGINNTGTLTVSNSTISGNTAGQGGSGGGFCNSAINSIATLRNVTITNNTAFTGGGIHQIAGTLNFGNTIVAGNTAASGIGPEIFFNNSGAITSAGGNLVGDSGNDSTNTGTFDIAYQPSDKQNVNPLLGPLQNNGGPTPTHALFVGSPAVDAGLNTLANGAGLTTDQRGTGFPRIRDGDGDGLAFVDIGAFEVQMVTTAATVSVSGRVLSSRGRGVSNAVVHLTNQKGEIQTARTNRSGYYTFQELEAGETYIFNVYAKRYQFNVQVMTLTEDLAELNFTAQ
ncbi:MAG: carboxypeptidase regulatory-like domain-containing protein, partial [Acidobacteria bacterium]|nr:carboxypeptidase regulatory-like domain-containing protein [Acidobacteriota bacterium]